MTILDSSIEKTRFFFHLVRDEKSRRRAMERFNGGKEDHPELQAVILHRSIKEVYDEAENF